MAGFMNLLGTALGGPAGGAGADLALALGTRLFGENPTTTTSSSRTGYDMSQLPVFQQLFGQAQAGAGQLGSQIQGLNAPREAAIGQSQDRQRNLLSNIYGEEQRRIQQGGLNLFGSGMQGLHQRNLGNTSLANAASARAQRNVNEGMAASRARQFQQQAGVEQQGAQMIDQAKRESIMQQLAPLMQLFALQQMPAQQAGRATAKNETSRTKRKGLLSKIFG